MENHYFCNNFYEFLTSNCEAYAGLEQIYLDFSDTKLGSLELQQLSDVMAHKKMPAVVQIDFSHNLITARGCKALSEMIKHPNTFEKLCLTLSKNYITDVGVNYFAEILRHAKAGFTLNLSQNNITDTGASLFADQLVVAPLNFSLGLSQNKIGEQGAIDLANAFGRAPSGFQLNLSENPIGQEGAFAIATHLPELPTSTSLSLSKCQIKKEGLLTICQQLAYAPDDFTLDLSSNDVIEGQGDDLAEMITFALQQENAPQNLCLNLGKLGISEVGGQFFLAMAKEGKAPEGLVLQLGNNEISESLMDKIDKALRHHDQMKALHRCFAFNFGVRDRHNLISHLPNEMLAMIYSYVFPAMAPQDLKDATSQIFNFFQHPTTTRKRKVEETESPSNKRAKNEPTANYFSCRIL